MSASPTVLEINRALAERINQEARDNPHSPYAGKFVGLANGQVVATANVGCLLQLRTGIQRRHLNARAAHVVELLDQAY